MRQPAPIASLTCEQCGGAFTMLAREAKRPNRGKYCGVPCMRKASRGVSPVPTTRETRTCPCGKSFTVAPSRAARGKGKFCSRECVAASQRTLVERTCYCGKSFTVKPSVERDGGGKYCSLTCCNSLRRDNATKFNRPPKSAPKPVRKPSPASQPVPVAPKPATDDLVWSGSNTVSCHGCGRTRERGQRCQCERLEGIAS